MHILSKLVHWYFSKDALPYWGVLLLDLLMVALACYLGNYMDWGGLALAQHFWPLTVGNGITLLLFAVAFRMLHTYTGILRYSSMIDLQRVGVAAFCGTLFSVVAAVAVSLSGTSQVMMHGVWGTLMLFVSATFLLWMERMMVRGLFDTFKTEDAKPIAIYGTKAGGISLANSIVTSHDKEYNLVAFVSDAEEMRNAYLLGKRVVMNGKGIGARLQELKVRVLLVSPLKSEMFRNNQGMIDEIMQAGIRVMMMPAAEEWDGKSKLTHQQLHEVEIEDLLPREKIEVDMEAIGRMLTGKRILITGAAGSIGSEMARQVAKFNPSELILLDQAETPMHDVRLYMARNHGELKVWTIVGSITNREQMERIFEEHRPEYVFHAAAYKHVPMMEDNPAMAVQNNIYGTRVIADLAVKYGTKKFVMISTDKAVNPTNVMGCSKRICEIYCQSLNKAIVEGKVKGCTQFVTTRFGNVLGSNGSVIPIFKEQIRKGGPITVTHPEIIRYFMLIPEACRLVLEAGTMGHGGEIFVFDMGKPVKIVDLAKRMISLSGAKHIEIKFSGLRDGEKLYEELLSTKENTKPTVHPKIMVAQVREYDYEVACRNEERLMQVSYSFDDMAIVKVMKEIVPEYKSQCSKYEALDK